MQDRSARGHGSELRIGIAPDYKPIVWKENDKIVGVEVEFAKALAKELGRKADIREIAWEDLFAALDNGEIDIIMSGVSITPERAQRYLFSSPYMQIGQMAIIRLADVARLSAAGAMYSGMYRIGYVKETTGEKFVLQNLEGELKGFANVENGVQALVDKDIDFFIHDAPTVWRLANDAITNGQLLGIYKPLTQENLAWVMRKDNIALKNEIETVYAKWLKSGFIHKTVKKWVPVMIVQSAGP